MQRWNFEWPGVVRMHVGKEGREAGGGRMASQLGTCPLGSDTPLVPSSREALPGGGGRGGAETGEAVITVYTTHNMFTTLLSVHMHKLVSDTLVIPCR